MTEQNIALVKQAYNNFQTGNIPALLEMLPDNVTWHLPEIEGVPFAGKRTGREAVRDFFLGVEANQKTVEFEPREFVAQGDKVVSLGHYRWRVTSTGREFSSDFAHVFTVHDGKIIAFQEYTDTAASAAAYQKAMRA